MDDNKRRQRQPSRLEKRILLKKQKQMEQTAVVVEEAVMEPTQWWLPRSQGEEMRRKITAKGETDQKNRKQMSEEDLNPNLRKSIKKKS